MKRCTWLIIVAAVLPVSADASDELFERIGEALTWHAQDAILRARLSGIVDLEGFAYSHPSPGLIESEKKTLFAPRLTALLDLQVGPHLYGFVQARADRGFDPSDESLETRLDEYALRLTPWDDGRLSWQVGKFATVVGNWIQRHNAWENPFVTAPLPYENLTGVWDTAPPNSAATLFGWAHVRPRAEPGVVATDKHLRLPIVWGPAYAHGAAVSGKLSRFTYALEMKNAALSARPGLWDSARFADGHETWSARIGYLPDMRWNFGLSASSGSYLEPAAATRLPSGRKIGEYRQRVIAHDISFAWHHLQVWAEFFASRFEIPGIGDADTVAYYVEARYKFTPQFFGAIRWNEQLFAIMPDGAGGRMRWGGNVRRLDFAPSYRLTPHAQVKLQYSVEYHELRSRPFSHWAAAQFTLRF